MINASDFRNGVTFEMDNGVWTIVSFLHVKPGKGAAFVRTKIKNIVTGSVLERTFNPTDKFPRAYIETKEMQYTYNDGEFYHFMDLETYDQIPLAKSNLGDNFRFVKEETMCKISFWNGNVISVEPPTFVELVVTECEPGVKGNTATNVQKNAVVETGATIKVPIFIDEGDVIRIDTRDGGSYLERA